MNAQRQSSKVVPLPNRVSVQFWVAPELREKFRAAVEKQERSVAQALRHHMAEVVANDKEAA